MPKRQKGPSCDGPFIRLVRLAGIEPTTPWFVAKYSIQLSYSREKRDYSRGLSEMEEFKCALLNNRNAQILNAIESRYPEFFQRAFQYKVFHACVTVCNARQR
jgi:hypothetical protein